MDDFFAPLIRTNRGKKTAARAMPVDTFKYDIGMHVAHYHAYAFFERS
jgi:hypothetical protein